VGRRSSNVRGCDGYGWAGVVLLLVSIIHIFIFFRCRQCFTGINMYKHSEMWFTSNSINTHCSIQPHGKNTKLSLRGIIVPYPPSPDPPVVNLRYPELSGLMQ